MSIWIVLDDALGSDVVSCEGRLILLETLESTPITGVDMNVTDEEVERVRTLSNQVVPNNPGSPRLVDGAREKHIVPGYQQTARNWESEQAAWKILARGSHGDLSTERCREGCLSEGHYGDSSHSQFLEFLCKKGPNLLTNNLKNKGEVCSVLLTMADNVKVLQPANEPLSRDILDMTMWRVSLRELVLEMKTVEESFPSLIGNSGVYVLSASPYAAFLRALAAEISDRHN